MFEELGPEAANQFRLFVDTMEAAGQPVRYDYALVNGERRLIVPTETALRFCDWLGTPRAQSFAAWIRANFGTSERVE